MTLPRKLAVFDVDGTLVDSQAHILASMTAAFQASGRPVPPRADVLGIVGLSLPVALQRLVPGLGTTELQQMVEDYKSAFAALRVSDGLALSPLFPGVREMLDTLADRDDLVMGVATGKTRRGLEHLLDMLDLRRYFVTTQVADDHPSKPHPAMLEAALAGAGCSAGDAVMIGDTVFDLEMGKAAGVATIAVTWGYHADAALAACGPDAMARDVPGLTRDLHHILELADE